MSYINMKHDKHETTLREISLLKLEERKRETMIKMKSLVLIDANFTYI
jgi:hypothetical protein